MDDAILYLEDKIDNKSSAALDFALATMYYQRGRLTMSSQSYQNAIEKFPSFLRAYKNLGFIKLTKNQFDDAAQNFPVPLVSANLGVTIALGYCYYVQKYISAENAYRMSVLFRKQVQQRLVNCLIATERFHETLALLDELLIKSKYILSSWAATLQGLNREKRRLFYLKL